MGTALVTCCGREDPIHEQMNTEHVQAQHTTKTVISSNKNDENALEEPLNSGQENKGTDTV